MRSKFDNPKAVELFVLKDEDGYILYAPLAKLTARINESVAIAVGRKLSGEPLSEDEQNAIDLLQKHGFFDEKVLPISNEAFAPVHVTLFPTDACNLRCRYCYANAEAGSVKMPIEVAKAAIDYVAFNSVLKGRKNFLIGFHGNGEPFMAFDVLKESCLYALEKAEQLKTKALLNTATNGVLTDEAMDFVIAYMTNVNVSFDGLPHLQDRQRPFPNGKGSFEVVNRTLRRLDAAGKSYGIRATLTSESVQLLGDIVDFTLENYPNCTQLHIEPAWECGRCLKTGEQSPDVDLFISNFLSSVDKTRGTKLNLIYSGARHNLITNAFCNFSRGTFTVTAKGFVTSCYEVCDTSDPKSERFFYGQYDKDKGEFVFDYNKLNALSKLTVENIGFCSDCFCKWHCGGDCAAKVLKLKDASEHSGSDRCRINRAVTLKQIQRNIPNDLQMKEMELK